MATDYSQVACDRLDDEMWSMNAAEHSPPAMINTSFRDMVDKKQFSLLDYRVLYLITETNSGQVGPNDGHRCM